MNLLDKKELERIHGGIQFPWKNSKDIWCNIFSSLTGGIIVSLLVNTFTSGDNRVYALNEIPEIVRRSQLKVYTSQITAIQERKPPNLNMSRYAETHPSNMDEIQLSLAIEGVETNYLRNTQNRSSIFVLRNAYYREVIKALLISRNIDEDQLRGAIERSADQLESRTFKYYIYNTLTCSREMEGFLSGMLGEGEIRVNYDVNRILNFLYVLPIAQRRDYFQNENNLINSAKKSVYITNIYRELYGKNNARTIFVNRVFRFDKLTLLSGTFGLCAGIVLSFTSMCDNNEENKNKNLNLL